MDLETLLETDLTSVDILRPLIKPGPVEFEVSDIKKEKTKKQKNTLTITLKTINMEKSVKNEVINPGFVLTHRISLDETEKYDSTRIMQELKKFRAGVTGNEKGSFMPLDQYLHLHVIGSVSVESDDTGEYPDQNRIRSFTKVK